MPDYEALAEEIRAKRHYREEADGTIYCSIGGCPGSVGLRCYRTGVAICKHCSVHTDVGYISKEAARDQQKVFFDAGNREYLLAGGTAFFTNLFVGFGAMILIRLLLSFLGFFGFIFAFFIATSAAGIISEAVWRVMNKKRGRYTGQIAAVGVVFSSLPLILLAGPLIFIVYVLVVITTLNARFQMGIRL